jgi:hypothetical protein
MLIIEYGITTKGNRTVPEENCLVIFARTKRETLFLHAIMLCELGIMEAFTSRNLPVLQSIGQTTSQDSLK